MHPVYPTWYLHWLLFYYGNEKSNCYEVILGLNKPKTMDSDLIITDFLSPMDCFTSSYPYSFTWNVTLYKILLWLKFDEIPSKVCHSPRTYHTQRGSVASIWSKIWRRKEMVIWSKPGCQNLHLEIQPTHTVCGKRRHSYSKPYVHIQTVHQSKASQFTYYLGGWAIWDSIAVWFYRHTFDKVAADIFKWVFSVFRVIKKFNFAISLL